MSITDAEIAGLIATAEGAATTFENAVLEQRFMIDAPDVSRDIERHIVLCSMSIRKCLTHMVSMNRASIRASIEIANITVRTLKTLQRLKPAGDLEHVLILEDVLYEERLSEMYANQADFQLRESMMRGIGDDFFDPADWWKQS